MTEDGAGGRGHKKNPVATLPQGLGDDGETRTDAAVAEEAKRRQIRKPADSVPATLPEQNRGETRTQVAEAVGMKPRTYAKTKQVYDTANDTTAPAPIRAVAQEQMAALDTGQTTASWPTSTGTAPPAPQTPPYAGGGFLCLSGRFLRPRGVLRGLWCNGGRELV